MAEQPQRVNAAQLAARKIKSAKPRRPGAGSRSTPETEEERVLNSVPTFADPNATAQRFFGNVSNTSSTFGNGFQLPSSNSFDFSLGGGVPQISFGSPVATPQPETNHDPNYRVDTTGEEAARKHKPFRMMENGPAAQLNTPFTIAQPTQPVQQPNFQQNDAAARLNTPFNITHSIQPTPQPNSQQSNVFGSSVTSSFGDQSRPSGGFTFGQQSAAPAASNIFSQAPSTTSSSMFGMSNTAPTSQAPPSPPKQNSTPFGGFSNRSSQSPGPSSTGFFSSNPPAQTTSIFGNSDNTQVSAPPASSSLFSHLNSGPTTNIFGSSNNAQVSTPAASSNLFGQLNSAPTTNMFGSSSNGQISAPATSPSLFSNLNSAPTTNMFANPAESKDPTAAVSGLSQQQNSAPFSGFSAGVKPSQSSAPASNPINNTSSTSFSNMFAKTAETQAPATVTTAPTPSFNPSSTSGSNIFGKAAETTPSLFNGSSSQQPIPTPQSNIFAKPSESPAKATDAAVSTIDSPQSSNIFGNLTKASESAGQTPPKETSTSLSTASSSSSAQANIANEAAPFPSSSNNIFAQSSMTRQEPPPSPKPAPKSLSNGDTVLPSVEAPEIENDVKVLETLKDFWYYKREDLEERLQKLPKMAAGEVSELRAVFRHASLNNIFKAYVTSRKNPLEDYSTAMDTYQKVLADIDEELAKARGTTGRKSGRTNASNAPTNGTTQKAPLYSSPQKTSRATQNIFASPDKPYTTPTNGSTTPKAAPPTATKLVPGLEPSSASTAVDMQKASVEARKDKPNGTSDKETSSERQSNLNGNSQAQASSNLFSSQLGISSPSASTPKSTAPPTSATTPASSAHATSTPSLGGKRKAEVQLTKDDPTGEEAEVRSKKQTRPMSNSMNRMKNILDSSDKSAASETPVKSNPFASLPVPATTSKSSVETPSKPNPFAALPVPATAPPAATAKPSAFSFGSSSTSGTKSGTSSNLFAAKSDASATLNSASKPLFGNTASVFSPSSSESQVGPSIPSQSIFAPKSTPDPTEAPASNLFASKLSSITPTSTAPAAFKPPTFGSGSGSGPTNFLAQFGQQAKKDEEEAEKKAMQRAKDEDMDSDEDEAEWEAKYKEKRKAEKKALEDAAKNRAGFVPGKGFSFGASSVQGESGKPATSSTSSANLSGSSTPKTNNIFGQSTSSQPTSGATKSIFAPTSTPAATSSIFGQHASTGPSSLFVPPNRSETSSPASVFDSQEIKKSVTFGNPFGHLSDVDSGADNGRGSADDDSTDGDDEDVEEDENQENTDPNDENSDPSYNPDKDKENEPGTPGTPAEETGAGIASAKKQSSLFNFTPSGSGVATPNKFGSSIFGASQPASGTSTPTSSGGLFDRISRDNKGNPIRKVPTEDKENSGPASNSVFGTSSIFSANTGSSNPFSSLNKTPSGPTTSPGDNTWKQNTPIKFGASTASAAPSLNVTAATPEKPSDKPSPFAGLFGNNSTPKPTLFAGFGGEKTASPGFSFGGAGPSATSSLFPSAAVSNNTSRATTPGATTDNDSASEANDPEAEHHEQLDLASSAAGEEEEDVMYTVRTKALKFVAPTEETKGAQWITKGLGPLKVLKHRTSGACRVLLRADPSGTIVLNKSVMPNFNYEATKKTVKLTAADESGKGLETWLLQVKTEEMAKELATSLEENKAK